MIYIGERMKEFRCLPLVISGEKVISSVGTFRFNKGDFLNKYRKLAKGTSSSKSTASNKTVIFENCVYEIDDIEVKGIDNVVFRNCIVNASRFSIKSSKLVVFDSCTIRSKRITLTNEWLVGENFIIRNSVLDNTVYTYSGKDEQFIHIDSYARTKEGTFLLVDDSLIRWKGGEISVLGVNHVLMNNIVVEVDDDSKRRKSEIVRDVEISYISNINLRNVEVKTSRETIFKLEVIGRERVIPKINFVTDEDKFRELLKNVRVESDDLENPLQFAKVFFKK